MQFPQSLFPNCLPPFASPPLVLTTPRLLWYHPHSSSPNQRTNSHAGSNVLVVLFRIRYSYSQQLSRNPYLGYRQYNPYNGKPKHLPPAYSPVLQQQSSILRCYQNTPRSQRNAFSLLR